MKPQNILPPIFPQQPQLSAGKFFEIFFKKHLHFVCRCVIISLGEKIRAIRQPNGVLAQLVARHTGSVEVTGSNPVCSTNNENKLKLNKFQLVFVHVNH